MVPGSVTAPRTLDTGVDVGIHEDSEFGLKIAAQDAVKFEHRLATQLPAAALVSLGRVREAVAKYDLAFGQRGLNYFLDVLGARGEHQREFGQRGQIRSASVEKYMSNLLANISSAGLASDQDFEAVGSQYLGESLQLCALAGSVKAFDGDEFSPMRHGTIIAFDAGHSFCHRAWLRAALRSF
jgi:hypothetical protein